MSSSHEDPDEDDALSSDSEGGLGGFFFAGVVSFVKDFISSSNLVFPRSWVDFFFAVQKEKNITISSTVR
jgi:hypothetical protein